MGNILVIGDLHEPFCLDKYLVFNKMLYKKYKCTRVVFIGDIIDGHAWSYHEPDPDGKSPGDEFDIAVKRLGRWYKAFPVADVTMGNHDLLGIRKVRTAGLPKAFMKDFGEAIKAPKTWKFHMTGIRIDGNNYVHGTTGNAIKRAKDSRISTIQGHLHSQAFSEWSVSEKDKLFGLQVGCGINRKAYAFAYGKDLPKKPIIGSGLVLDNGKLPIIELMDL